MGKSQLEALHGTPRQVRVSVPAEVSFNAERMQKLTANLLGRLGCLGCHSGYDIRFIQELDFLVNPKTLEIEGHVGGGMF